MGYAAWKTSNGWMNEALLCVLYTILVIGEWPVLFLVKRELPIF